MSGKWSFGHVRVLAAVAVMTSGSLIATASSIVEEPGEPPSVDESLRAIRDPRPAARLDAIRELQWAGKKELVAPALADALLDPVSQVRIAALDALWGIGPLGDEVPGSLEWRIELALSDPDPDVRIAAVGAATTLDSPVERLDTMLRIVEAVAMEDPSTRVNHAVRLLAALGPVVVPDALSMARHAIPSTRHRFVEIVTLAGELPGEHIDDVLSLLQDTDAWVRLRAAQALSSVCAPPERVVIALTAAASDPDWSVRAYATSPSCRQKIGRASLVGIMDPAPR